MPKPESEKVHVGHGILFLLQTVISAHPCRLRLRDDALLYEQTLIHLSLDGDYVESITTNSDVCCGNGSRDGQSIIPRARSQFRTLVNYPFFDSRRMHRDASMGAGCPVSRVVMWGGWVCRSAESEPRTQAHVHVLGRKA
jgi:hypothetical protein